MRILLLGGRGVFGTEFFNLCKKYKILIKAPKSKELDIINIKKVKKFIQKYKPTHIINAAVFMGIDPCHDNFKKAFEVNALSVLNLCKICEEKNITFVQTSSHAVFDGNKSKPYTESDQPLQNNVYGATKYSAESFTSSICKKFYIARFPTMYGNRRNKVRGFVDKMLIKLKKNEKIFVAKDKMDSVSYAKDLSKCLLNILKKKLTYGTYHIQNHGFISYYEFIIYLKKKIKSKSKIISVKDSYFKSKNFKPLRTSITSIKLKKLRGWKEALGDYLQSERII
tara:strand:- start:147 stop:992 length:846 start_codon:yes stop_codon:yes gene_type:complete